MSFTLKKKRVKTDDIYGPKGHVNRYAQCNMCGKLFALFLLSMGPFDRDPSLPHVQIT